MEVRNCGCGYRMRKVGYKWVCDSCCNVEAYQDESESTETSILLTMPVENAGYDSNQCKSLDHKSSVLQMQAIHFAMMHYFGGGSTGILATDWQEKRDKEFPGLFNRGYL